MIKKLSLLCLSLSGLLLAQGPLAVARAGNVALRKQLNLTTDQVKQIRDIRKQQLDQTQAQRDQLHAGTKNLRALMQSENPDPAAVGRQMIELKQLRQTLQQSRSAAAEKVKAILTPEQKQKLAELEKVPAARRARGLGLLAPAPKQ